MYAWYIAAGAGPGKKERKNPQYPREK